MLRNKIKSMQIRKLKEKCYVNICEMKTFYMYKVIRSFAVISSFYLFFVRNIYVHKNKMWALNHVDDNVSAFFLCL